MHGMSEVFEYYDYRSRRKVVFYKLMDETNKRNSI